MNKCSISTLGRGHIESIEIYDNQFDEFSLVGTYCFLRKLITHEVSYLCFKALKK